MKICLITRGNANSISADEIEAVTNAFLANNGQKNKDHKRELMTINNIELSVAKRILCNASV